MIIKGINLVFRGKRIIVNGIDIGFINGYRWCATNYRSAGGEYYMTIEGQQYRYGDVPYADDCKKVCKYDNILPLLAQIAEQKKNGQPITIQLFNEYGGLN